MNQLPPNAFVDYHHSDKGIFGFVGPYYFLSNFYTSNDQEIDFYWVRNGKLKHISCKNVEIPYQASKSLDPDEIEFVLEASSASEAKFRGQTVTLREDWDEVKITIMEPLVYQKYHNSLRLWSALAETKGLPLSEWNSWGDSFWGMIKNNEGRWVGANWHGRITMMVRAKLFNLCDCCRRLQVICEKELEPTVRVCIPCMKHDVIFSPCSMIKPKEHTIKEYQ